MFEITVMENFTPTESVPDNLAVPSGPAPGQSNGGYPVVPDSPISPENPVPGNLGQGNSGYKSGYSISVQRPDNL